MAAVRFYPIPASFDATFWNELNRLKLDEWKLEDKEQPIHANLPFVAEANLAYTFSMDYSSFKVAEEDQADNVKGILYLYNTIEHFNDQTRRKEHMNQHGQKLWDLIRDGSWTKNPRELLRFIIFMFADLKEFYYRFHTGVPTLSFPKDGLKVGDCAMRSDIQQELSKFQFSSFDSFPKLFSFTNGKAAIYDFDQLPNLNNEETWVITSVIDPKNTDVLHWEIRNLITAIAFHPVKWTSIKVAAIRPDCSISTSKVFSWDSSVLDEKNFTVVGLGNNIPLTFNLKSFFSKDELISQAADLNVKLVRWRMVPDLNLEKFKCKVLMLGSGTLGCNLARGILGWGMRNITFVDCGDVSMSNPVRQSLFDASDIGKPKAEAAAQSLKRIFPNAQVTALSMKIPMPGHPAGNDFEKVMAAVKQLEELIKSHDVIFLATDSRESRWLPTLLATAYSKLAFTVALGFDTFVVMRHGIGPNSEMHQSNFHKDLEISGKDLGCYFCLDVTAPGNSISDRTIDQQCTISRSGLSQIACGIAVELLASILQHSQGAEASAKLVGVNENSGTLGATPHQVRGHISAFNLNTATTQRSSICCGCSLKVCNKLSNENEWKEFIRGVLDDPRYLEKVCGLLELQEAANMIEDSIIPMSDSDDSS
uniref:Ubiquitin-like modifier-activating enzyme ATG7 n=1 Tax=Panagrolaimus superbus TaxID=310955 RepID=A0A914ZCV3_9BILA